MYLLDTDTLIYSLKGHQTVVEHFKLHADFPKAISVITYGELVYGAEKSKYVTKNLAKVHRLREIYPVIELSCAIMDTFGKIKADLKRADNTVDDFDLLIGATALTIGYRVVSNNEKHFNKIPGVQVDNWSRR